MESPDPERAALLHDLGKAEEDMRQTTERLQAGRLEWDDYDVLYATFKARADFARSALEALAEPMVGLPPADEMRREWDAGRLTLRQKRALLEVYITAVTVLPAPAGKVPATVGERLGRRLKVEWRA